MRTLIDTNILLDLILDRAPFVQEAEQIWEAVRAGRFDGYISAMSVPNIFYIVRKAQGANKAREAVYAVLTAFNVCRLDWDSLNMALNLPLDDYEDAVQLASALIADLDTVVTRDPQGFVGSSLLVLSPVDFLTRLSAVD